MPTSASKSPGSVRIVSRGRNAFWDRAEAGRLLAAELDSYRDRNPVVLGIPRGGILIARELARALGGDLDVVLAHKLGTPGQPELAMGSVAEDGKVFLNEDITRPLGIKQADIQSEKERQLGQIERRIEMIRRVRPKVPLNGRVAIVTDDGVATGATTQAALWAVRSEGPERLIAAMPVGPEDTIRRLAEFADEMLCMRAPPLFAAVGQFYEHFGPVEDDEMLRILADEAAKSKSQETRIREHRMGPNSPAN